MGNDTDRLQQMENNFNTGDSIYQALGVQQATMRNLAKQREEEKYEEALEYFLDDGFTRELAEEYASAMVLNGNKVEQYKCPSYADDNGDIQDCLCGKCV